MEENGMSREWCECGEQKTNGRCPLDEEGKLVTVYRATTLHGSVCHFGKFALAKHWAGPKGRVDTLELPVGTELVAVHKPMTPLQIIESAMAAQSHWELPSNTELRQVAERLADLEAMASKHPELLAAIKGDSS
jgi:hypothetical protein